MNEKLKLLMGYLAKIKKIRQNWTRQENSDIWLCVCVDCYFQKLFSVGES